MYMYPLRRPPPHSLSRKEDYMYCLRGKCYSLLLIPTRRPVVERLNGRGNAAALSLGLHHFSGDTAREDADRLAEV